MASTKETVQAAVAADSLAARYAYIRNTTVQLCQHLEPEDYVVVQVTRVDSVREAVPELAWAQIEAVSEDGTVFGVELDVVVIGGGAAGLNAALAAQEKGLSVVTLEKSKIANTIENAVYKTVAHGKTFRTSKDDTVGNDQADKHR